jgi:hypothetical protein
MEDPLQSQHESEQRALTLVQIGRSSLMTIASRIIVNAREYADYGNRHRAMQTVFRNGDKNICKSS